ncbi:MAG: hypothetical protein FWF84_07715 [Kiritimatiellaeota bacterium]|nr:hypothetical protein [Kiritimatiellota bacterium]
MSRPIVFVPDIESVKRKFANPSPRLARLRARFDERLERDKAFRELHIFLPALLGEKAALEEGKAILMRLAKDPIELAHEQSPGNTISSEDSLEGHIWCVAPRAMRLAAFFTWLDHHGVWSKAEREEVAMNLMGFYDHYVVPVLRSRTPAGHNQQLSMVFCSAVVGYVFSQEPCVAARAKGLFEWAMPKLKQSLGLMEPGGFSGEGTAYQTGVVSPLVLWIIVFLEQLGEKDVWQTPRLPRGATLSDTLRVEAVMGSCGGLMPPWDHYGWIATHNLAARTFWASVSGESHLLDITEEAWDRPTFIAWRDDDRLWTMLYWPECEPATTGAHTGAPLQGWGIKEVGAATECPGRKLRVMCAWDVGGGGLGPGRSQVNPNHLMIDMGGHIVTQDGTNRSGVPLFAEAATERTWAGFSAEEQAAIGGREGFKRWVLANQEGLLGASSGILVDGWEGYFNRDVRRGALVYEKRDAGLHVFSGESSPYYQNAFDIRRMRRTVAMTPDGVTWIVDDIESDTPHDYDWRVWFRKEAALSGDNVLRVSTPKDTLCFAWKAFADGAAVAASPTLMAVETFPTSLPTLIGSQQGSVRCDLRATGRTVRFVTCMLPQNVSMLRIENIKNSEPRTQNSECWRATWDGGEATFAMPKEVADIPDIPYVTGEQYEIPESFSDLDEIPYIHTDKTDEELLASLDDPAPKEWRKIGEAMLALTLRGRADAFPKIERLMLDMRQNYTVWSVAAWCLGHARHRASLPALEKTRYCREVNTALRALWACERM